jgi:hypothetical protein
MSAGPDLGSESDKENIHSKSITKRKIPEGKP